MEMSDPASLPEARQLIRDIRNLVRRFQLSEQADVRCCGMTVAQAATITVLHVEGPLRLSVLSRRLGIAPSTLTRNVERIERRGLVERIADPEDGRATLLRLSAAGRRQGQTLEERNEVAARYLLNELSQGRRRRLLAGLRDLLKTLDSVSESCGPDGCDQPLGDPASRPEVAEER